MKNPNPETIKYKLAKLGITQAMLAKYFNCSAVYINNLIHIQRKTKNKKFTEIIEFATGAKSFPFEQVAEPPQVSKANHSINQNG